MESAVLVVRDLRVYYHTHRGAVKAVNGVSFEIGAGERFGLVGESGSGKSTIALALLRLIKPPGQIESGDVILAGRNLRTLSDDQMRHVRLADISLVAQGAMNSLNPVLRVRDQIRDGLRDHGVRRSGAEFERWSADLLRSVGLRPEVADMFPHELSGGMKQRVCMAIAISLKPRLIIADEPTSALDVVVQRQVMATLISAQEQIDAAVILIGHDMGLMAQVVDRVGIMYAGDLVEVSAVADLFREPLHPYSQLLIASLPNLETKTGFQGIPGLPPSLLNRPTGCPFRSRCPKAMDVCAVVTPLPLPVGDGRTVACHLYHSVDDATTAVAS